MIEPVTDTDHRTIVQPSITCSVCGHTSHHPTDIADGYCGNCHDWTSTPRQPPLEQAPTPWSQQGTTP